MHLIRWVLVAVLCLLLVACDDNTAGNQKVQQVEDSSVLLAGRDATIVENQIIGQQTVIKNTQELIDALQQHQQQQNQSLSLFQQYMLLLGVAFLFLIFSMALVYFLFFRLCHDTTRERLITDLREGLVHQRLYKRSVTSLLGGIEKVYGKIDQPLQAFNASLLLAFLYPILLFTFAYSFAGGVYFFSNKIIFPESRELAILYFPTLIVVGFFIYFVLKRREAIDNWIIAKIKQSLSLSDPVANQVWGMLIGGCLAHINFYWLHKADINWALGGYIFGVFAGIISIPVSIGVSIAANMSISGLSSIMMFVVVLAHSNTIYVKVIVPILFFTASGFAVAFFVFTKNHNAAMFFLSFYMIFPILNALLDWLSWWVSRYFLAKTLQTNNWLYIGLELLADAAFAVVCLVLLCILLPAGAIALDALATNFNWIDKDMVTLAQTNWQYHAYAAAVDPRGKGLMVTAMLFSTLIPTVLHLVFGCTAVITHLLHGDKLADFLASTPKGHQFRYFRASLWLCGYGVLTLILVVTIVMGVLQLLNLPVGTWLYNFTYSIYADYGMQAL